MPKDQTCFPCDCRDYGVSPGENGEPRKVALPGKPGRGVSTRYLVFCCLLSAMGASAVSFMVMSPVADYCLSPLATVPGLADAPPSAYMLPHVYGVKE